MKTVKGKIATAIGAMMLLSCVINASCDACVTFVAQDTYIIDESGCVDY